MTDLLRDPSLARSYSVTSSQTFFSNPVVNSCLSRSYNFQVKNAVVLEEMNRRHSMEGVSARRYNFGHSTSFNNAFFSNFSKDHTSNSVTLYRNCNCLKSKKEIL